MRWTATQDQRLLLLICRTTKISHRGIAQAWAKEYTNDDEVPTERAIQEHLSLLSKKVNAMHSPIKSATSTPKTPKTFKTAKTPKAAKTTTTGEKRKLIDADMDYDSEPENPYAMSPSLKRESMPRSSKSKKDYAVILDSEDDGTDDVQVKTESMDLFPAGDADSVKKSSKMIDFADCESDISEYTPHAVFN